MGPVLLVTNTAAGGSGDDLVAAALAVLRERTVVELARTSSPGQLDDLLGRLDSRRLVVAGGDGTLHAVVAGLHRRGELSEATLALVPTGTGNDFARGVGIPLEVDEAAVLAAEGLPRSLDLLVADGDEVVVNAVHVGVGAEAARAASRWKRVLGRVGYALGAVVAGFRTPGLRLRVEADGVVVADEGRRVIQVGIGNGPQVGGGTALAPGARVDDGRADVVVSFATRPWARAGYSLQLLRGAHHRRADVRALRATEVRVTGEPFTCNTDGELSEPETERTWRVKPAAWRMVLPEAGSGG